MNRPAFVVDVGTNRYGDRVSQTLTGRIRELAERYATPLPNLTDEVATAAENDSWGRIKASLSQ